MGYLLTELNDIERAVRSMRDVLSQEHMIGIKSGLNLASMLTTVSTLAVGISTGDRVQIRTALERIAAEAEIWLEVMDAGQDELL